MDRRIRQLELIVHGDQENLPAVSALVREYKRVRWKHRGRTLDEWAAMAVSNSEAERSYATLAVKELGVVGIFIIFKAALSAPFRQAVNLISVIEDIGPMARPALRTLAKRRRNDPVGCAAASAVARLASLG